MNDSLRRFALALPEVEEGVACAGTALEARTFARGRKSFLFLRASDARLKLGPSLAEAERLADGDPERCRVGANGWVHVQLEGAGDLRKRIEAWIAESHALAGGAHEVARKPASAGGAQSARRSVKQASRKAARKAKKRS